MVASTPGDQTARRLERERRARREAEAIAEQVLRELYETVRLLQGSRAVLDETTDFVAIADLSGQASYINRAMRELLGHDGDDDEVNVFDLLTAASRERLVRDALPVVSDKGLWRGELAMLQPETGREIPVSQVLIGHRGPDGSIDVISTISRDITDRLAVERQLTHLAFHDPLTGLPNRRLFFDRLDIALARADRTAEPVGVFFVDLDGFKPINDTFGHDAGDEVLDTTAQRLANCLRPSDTVARLGGDEFAALCEHVTNRGGAAAIADRLGSHISQPIRIGDGDLTVTASIGVALAFSAPAGGPEAILREADAAMYFAKRAGGARHHVFGKDTPPAI